MKKALISTLFPIALIVLGISAAPSISAATITVGGTASGASGVTTSVAGAHVDTFDNGSLPSNYVATNSKPVVSGSVYGQYTQPAGDSTSYLTTGIGSVTIKYTNSINYFGLYWSTVDNYNTIQFTKTNGVTESFTGDALKTLGVTVDGTHSVYANFFDNSGLGWNKVVLGSTQNAFEADNVATATPEPGSMAMLGLGSLALGTLAARRRKAGAKLS